MQDAAPTGHPLHVTFADGARVTQAVAVADGAFEHIGNGLDAAMRIGGEPADGTFDGIVESEMVKQKERVKFIARMRTEGAPEQYARALDHQVGFDNFVEDLNVVAIDNI